MVLPKGNGSGILIMCALSLEAEPIAKALGLDERPSPLPKSFSSRFFCDDAGEKASLVTMGRCDRYMVDRIGLSSAAVVAWEGIRVLRPNLMINAGTAGGFIAKGARIGEVFLSNGRVAYHGRNMSAPRFSEFSLGNFACEDLTMYADIIGARLGKLSSADSVTASSDDLERMRALDIDAKDMEAAAIAEACYLSEIPFAALKAITDFVDSPIDTMEQFMANHEQATRSLAETMTKLIEVLSVNKRRLS